MLFATLPLISRMFVWFYSMCRPMSDFVFLCRPYIKNFELASIAGHPSTCDATPGNSVTCDGWGRA